MGRENVLNDGVFTKIVGTREKLSGYQQFIDYGKRFANGNSELVEFTGKYIDLVDKIKPSIEELSKVEEIVMQMRALENLEQNVKYSIGGRNNEYIYAYALFYRHDHIKKDIREIVGKTEVYGTEMEEFPGNLDLSNRAITSLERAMERVIQENVDNFIK